MHDAFEHPAFVDFFTHNRNVPADLYPSEWHFLRGLAEEAESVLDVGCAAAGFAEIWRTYNPGLRYTGVDISEPLVEAARNAHPEDEFITADAAKRIPLPDRAADVVAALGWLHWETRWRDALAELWRLTRRHLFFDIRLCAGSGEIVGVQSLLGDGETPYVCVGIDRLRETLHALGAAAVHAFGYFCPPAATVRGMPDELCAATFVLDRDPGRESSIQLPLEGFG